MQERNFSSLTGNVGMNMRKIWPRRCKNSAMATRGGYWWMRTQKNLKQTADFTQKTAR